MDKSDYSHLRVVLIDDDPMVLKTLQSALEALGFSVKAFGDPIQALEHVKKNEADIVISDICMPKCDGFQVLSEISAINAKCDVIFITAHGQMDIAIRALREGAADFIEKPISTAALNAAIERTERFRVLVQKRDLLADQLDRLNNELLYKSRNRNLMLGVSGVMRRITEQIVDVAASDATVLILGESGTGKELVAAAIHQASERRDKPFLTVNCPSIPDDLFESEMFGHRRGAFTGAVESRGGYLESARGGTLFLDEIGDLPVRSQAKILRLLEQKTFLPVGENKEREADVRILAATNQSLDDLVKEKTFREDLFYRLNVCAIRLPPLRERKEDIPLLALYFALQFAFETGKAIDGIDDDALRILMNYEYPGNIRELRNIIESSIIHTKHGGHLTKDDVPDQLAGIGPTSIGTGGEPWPMDTLKFENVERRLYEEALNRSGNNVSEAARILGLSRGKLRRRLEVLNISSENARNQS